MKDWNAAPILSARNLTRRYGEHIGCRDVSFDLWPGEVLGIVGESGSGKSTLLNMLSGRMEPTSGTIVYRDAAGRERNIHALPEGEKRRLLRSELGFVHQRPSDGLRMQVSAGANIGERLMAEGARHYGTLRGRALQWLERVEIDAGRIDDKPALFGAGVLRHSRAAIRKSAPEGPPCGRGGDQPPGSDGTLWGQPGGYGAFGERSSVFRRIVSASGKTEICTWRIIQGIIS